MLEHFYSFWDTATMVLFFSVSAVIAYFLGCFNGAVITSKYILHNDIRNHGSGNAGLTNFYRTFGGKLTFLVLLSDIIKAVLAIFLVKNLFFLLGGITGQGYVFVRYWAALWCILGHMFPCMFGFKGGKGILSGGTIAVLLDWRIALAVWGGFFLLAAVTRFVSLGSCWAGMMFPVMTHIIYKTVEITVLGAVIGILIVWMHRGNIKRLLSGTEHKFTLKKSESKSCERDGGT